MQNHANESLSILMSLFVNAVGYWVLMLPWHASLTAGFAQAQWQLVFASSLRMLPNNFLTQSQLSMAEPGLQGA